MSALGSLGPRAAGHLTVQFQGRRERVAVAGNNSALREVASVACEQLGAKVGMELDASGARLKHKGKELDLTLPWRFAFLPNNALVDLEVPIVGKIAKEGSSSSLSLRMEESADERKTAKEKEVKTVHVQVRFSNGTIHRARVNPENSLGEMLRSFAAIEKVKEAKHVVALVYMQRKIDSSSFEELSLAGLGFVEGSISFRGLLSGSENSSEDSYNAYEDVKMESAPPVKSAQVRTRSVKESVASIRQAYFDQDCRVIVKTLMKIITKILALPGDEKVRRMRFENAAFFEKIGQFSHALTFLEEIGFTRTETDVFLKSGDEDEDNLYIALRHLENLAVELGFSHEEIEIMKRVPSPGGSAIEQHTPTSSFDPYQTSVVKLGGELPVEPRSRVQEELSRLKAKRDKILAEAGIPKRRKSFFKPLPGFNARSFPAANSASGNAPFSDQNLLLKAMKDQQEKQEKRGKFSTQAMRDLETLKKSRIFTETLIRVQWPDKTILQAYFSPKESIKELSGMINEILRDELKDGFYLCVTPPLVRLQEEQTFEEAGLVPAALVYMHWKTTEARESFLRDPSSLADARSMDVDEAYSFPHAQAIDSDSFREAEIDAGTAEGVDASAQSSSPASASAKSSKRPKWFKM